jgi:cytosine/adenosine deaminase-related metal-dependent hydrolase
MKILKVNYILACDEKFNIYEDKAICFDEKILDIDDADKLKKRFPDAEFSDLGKGSVLMPGLINVHLHLEFSSNKNQLDYGDFITWLKSVIAKRDKLIQECDDSCIDKALEHIMKSGTTTIGAISSFGNDLESCVKTPLNVVYFNEVLGSDPSTVDAMYNDFMIRLENSKRYYSTNFIPAISIHSPYSTHPFLARKVLDIAKHEKLIVSTHFMESQAERDWLDSSSGDFKEFFNTFNPNAKPVNTSLEYIELFNGCKTLFTHACYANDHELKNMQDIGVITHSPRSNRFLSNKRLKVEKLDTFTLATDGLSSNNSLSLWDEMRAALMLHNEISLLELSKKLFHSVTLEASNSLDLNKGVLKVGKDADMIVLSMLDYEENTEKLALSLLMFTKEVKISYIGGKRLK